MDNRATVSEVKGSHDKVRMNVWIKRDILMGIEDIAKIDDVSVSDVVREALKNHIRKCKAKSSKG